MRRQEFGNQIKCDAVGAADSTHVFVFLPFSSSMLVLPQHSSTPSLLLLPASCLLFLFIIFFILLLLNVDMSSFSASSSCHLFFLLFSLCLFHLSTLHCCFHVFIGHSLVVFLFFCLFFFHPFIFLLFLKGSQLQLNLQTVVGLLIILELLPVTATVQVKLDSYQRSLGTFSAKHPVVI